MIKEVRDKPAVNQNYLQGDLKAAGTIIENIKLCSYNPHKRKHRDVHLKLAAKTNLNSHKMFSRQMTKIRIC